MKKYETPVLVVYGNLKDVTKATAATFNASQILSCHFRG